MVDGGGLENRWAKVSRVRILLPPPAYSRRDQDLNRVWPVQDEPPAHAGQTLIHPPKIKASVTNLCAAF